MRKRTEMELYEGKVINEGVREKEERRKKK